MPRPQAPPVQIARWRAGDWRDDRDQVAAEEPLQLSLDGSPLSIVMRTPGNDLELALGLLWAERVIQSNQVDIHLRSSAGRRPQRSFLSTSACGVCGATTVESLALDFPMLAPGPVVAAELLPRFSDRLRERQRIFETTGGLHAAGLFDERGELLMLREDIGRHNAVDKVVGRALLEGRFPLASSVLTVSGRAGYEVVQKA